MTTSEFLKFQDKNGDLLLDKCEVELPGPKKRFVLIVYQIQKLF